MAVTGSGTSADPYIVHDWAEFEATNTSTNKGKYIRFADIHISGGDWSIAGTGTSADPYVVSTYREMLHVTGASNIHLCKCIDKDLPNGERMYVYNEENPETHIVSSIYCRYNPSPSTIDYNDISTEYRGQIYIYTHVDFNGWTLRNFKITLTGASGSYQGGGFFSSQNVNPAINSEIYNLIFINAQGVSSVNTCALFSVNTHDCILQVELVCTGVAYTCLCFQVSSNFGNGFSRNSLSLKIDSNTTSFGGSDTGSVEVIDSIIDLDVIAYYGSGSRTGAPIKFTRSIVKGKFKYPSAGNYPFVGACIDSIYDVEHISAVSPPVPYANGSRCIFNNEKVSWSKTGWTGVTSEQLLDPSELQSVGFPIGVDNSE